MTTTTALMQEDYEFRELQQRVLADFREMPDLALTYEQAVRLWACHPAMCRAVLQSLVESRFLVLTRRAMFTRSH